jgi:hypothetical protein
MTLDYKFNIYYYRGKDLNTENEIDLVIIANRVCVK